MVFYFIFFIVFIYILYFLFIMAEQDKLKEDALEEIDKKKVET